MKILMIDNQIKSSFTVERKLTNIGFTVKVVSDVLEGIKLFEHFMPDLVIVDHRIPKLNAVAVIEYIRKEKNSQIPILIIVDGTAHSINEDEFQLGIVDYIQVPIVFEDLIARVDWLFTRARTAI